MRVSSSKTSSIIVKISSKKSKLFRNQNLVLIAKMLNSLNRAAKARPVEDLPDPGKPERNTI